MKKKVVCGVEKKNKKVQNRHGKRIEASACFSCLFITRQMYEKGKNGNKAILHTSINSGGFSLKTVGDKNKQFNKIEIKVDQIFG